MSASLQERFVGSLPNCLNIRTKTGNADSAENMAALKRRMEAG
jgi:hypothetical protein